VTRLPFYLEVKRKQKVQGYARFAQKTGDHQAKLSKLAPSLRQELQTMDNFTLVSLVFWLTGQGRSKSDIDSFTHLLSILC
jgi:hypothetical protein